MEQEQQEEERRRAEQREKKHRERERRERERPSVAECVQLSLAQRVHPQLRGEVVCTAGKRRGGGAPRLLRCPVACF